MKATELFVVCKPNDDMPWHSYATNVEGTGTCHNVTDAVILDHQSADCVLLNVNSRQGGGWRIVTLADGIAQDMTAAAFVGHTASNQLPQGAIKNDDNNLPDDRPWTFEEILAREG